MTANLQEEGFQNISNRNIAIVTLSSGRTIITKVSINEAYFRNCPSVWPLDV